MENLGNILIVSDGTVSINTPAAGNAVLFIDLDDGKLKYKKADGTVSAVTI